MKNGNKYGKRNFYLLPSLYTFLAGDGTTENEVLREILQTVYKQDATQIAEILKDGATPSEIKKSIFDLDIARVARINSGLENATFQDGYKKAKGEVLAAFETKLRETYGIADETVKGADLIAAIVTAKAGEGVATTEDAIKKTPTYQQLESRMKKELSDLKTTHDAQVKKMEADYKKEGTFNIVGKNALDILNGLNPILPKSATVAETYRQDFLNEMKGFEYEIQDNKTLVLKDGKLLTDVHGNTLTYEEHVKNIASKRFEFAVNNGGDNSGAAPDKTKQPPAGGVYPAGITKPKNDAELTAIMNNTTLKAADKRIVIDTYRKEKSAAV